MDITAINVPKDIAGSNIAQSHAQSASRSGTDDVANKPAAASIDDKRGQKSVDPKKVQQMTEAMNQFVEAMDAHIRFTLHEKTNELMVQVVDQSNNKVLKEFPPHEFLDTIAAIRSYVGILLDKKI